MTPFRKTVWIVVFALLVGLSIPWFVWGTGELYLGIPDWVWWHSVWMFLASLCFYRFTRGAWDEFIGGSSDE